MKKILLLILFIQQLTYGQAPDSAIKIQPIDYNMAEIKPVFPGGNTEFSKFISKNFVTPEVEGLNGVLQVSFVIELDGSITEIKVIKDLGSGTKEAALNLVKKFPKWSTGELEGNKVRVRYILPITIKTN